MKAKRALGPFRHFMARPKLMVAVVFGVVVYWLFPARGLDIATRALIAWNAAIVLLLVLAGIAMRRATGESMRKHAQELDEGHYTVLIMAFVAATASLAAIVFELINLRDRSGGDAGLYIGLSGLTILTAWSFIHVIFTEHYAHEFYVDRDLKTADIQESQGLKFPGTREPDYLDFLYFTFTIGVANQTADIAIESRAMRVLVLIHSIISYFFNTIILALTINIAASLLQK
ncbi:DUF1345 domain-containing protein [Rhizobium sp. TH2]|uniref:DUF1345 domain-containing protein n=1 Tax=Rhizobium sp. TH2 TaxID=2775403 RepID=UPI0021589657|nr:DUF1345 domain-containing protein [Rhizobium sp. TH2]UVC07653.1 DUF1345 domain-containing protein [Rhizobium sp. TH2]